MGRFQIGFYIFKEFKAKLPINKFFFFNSSEVLYFSPRSSTWLRCLPNHLVKIDFHGQQQRGVCVGAAVLRLAGRLASTEAQSCNILTAGRAVLGFSGSVSLRIIISHIHQHKIKHLFKASSKGYYQV